MAEFYKKKYEKKNHLMLDPEEEELCEEDRVGDHIEDEETQERFREEPEEENVLIEIDANGKYIFYPGEEMTRVLM